MNINDDIPLVSLKKLTKPLKLDDEKDTLEEDYKEL